MLHILEIKGSCVLGRSKRTRADLTVVELRSCRRIVVGFFLGLLEEMQIHGKGWLSPKAFALSKLNVIAGRDLSKLMGHVKPCRDDSSLSLGT